MDTPRRKPYRLPNNGIAALIAQLDADRCDLGIAALKADLRHAGWPARSPGDDQADRKPRITHICDCGAKFPSIDAWTWHRDDTGHDSYSEVPAPEGSALDYSDPTGELALAYERAHDDLEQIQDLQRELTHVLQRLVAVTSRYVPTTVAAPACSRADCDDEVERNSSGKGYRGLKEVAGIWCATPGAKALCGRHRKAAERAEREEAEARAAWIEEHAA